ncbi:MAG TPA: UvrD-helicase domain-containing protein, partial [Candidatus Limnocylindria bacterium]|nr:UvrD-helicase domain-containing protein [Candidatus Limnocylindria bacterium]
MTLDLFGAPPERPAPESPAPTRPPNPPRTPLADGEGRARIRSDLDTTLVVEAAAGTGKTTELVTRMVALLAAGRGQLERMVAVTFTEVAAGELKLRLRTAIEVARLDSGRPESERRRLTDSLPQLEQARIGTIHAFCRDLLSERPVEAGVDPSFEVAPEDEARRLFERVFDRWFERQLAGPGPAVRRILRRWRREPGFGPRRRGRDEGPRAILRDAAWALVDRRDFPAPWRRNVDFDRDREIDALVADLEDLAGWAARGNPEDWFTKSLAKVAGFVEDLRRVESMRGRDHDGLEAELTAFLTRDRNHWTWKGFSRGDDPSFPRNELRTKRNDAHARLTRFVQASGADLAPMLRDELWPVVTDYESAKAQAGCLDFTDLLIRARDLVREDTEVRAELQQRFTHVFVDEFQDTDPLQVEILFLLAAADSAETGWRRVQVVPGKLFVVADPKQSIYRFRRADVGLYEGVKRQLLDGGAELVELNVSFRSVPEIQRAVNSAFSVHMDGRSQTQARYVALAPARSDVSEQPAVIALPVPAPYGDYGKVVDWRIDESLPDAVAAFVHWLIDKSGWTVTEREKPDERVPIRPRHICLLFRRFRSFDRDVTRPYVLALEARHVPHLLVGGSSFHEREEVEAIRNALLAIERPEDELALFATLRGPMFGFSDAALLAYRERMKSLHPFRRVPEDLPPPLVEVAEALALLRDLHRGRNRRPVADTISRLLEATRAHAGFANWPNGPQALANLGRMIELARRAERRGLISFRAFVARLADEAERSDASDAPIIEEGVEGVRIMTVHRAKGLEFPIVILADMTANETPEQPSRWVDAEAGLCAMRLAGCLPPELLEHATEEMEREREEAVRLLYVAATRARDLLVVPVVADERREGWLQALTPVIYPEALRARELEMEDAPGCPQFGSDAVVSRSEQGEIPLASVIPGLHRPEVGEHRVVWWDPHQLELGVRETLGLAQTRILEADTNSERAQSGVEAHLQWKSRRGTVRIQGATPSLVVTTATVKAEDESLSTGDVTVEAVERAAERPRGTRFGRLVHALLSQIALDANSETIAAHARLQARLLAAEDSERDAAVEAVVATLAHPLLRRAS